MKIAVIGARGRIGRKLVRRLRALDCAVVEASPTLGVDAVTGRGLAAALHGATVVVDVSNPHSREGAAASQFFSASCHNLLTAGRAAGVRHHVALSIVGVDRIPGVDYFDAKRTQEALIMGSPIPFTIVRSTQFFELVRDVVQDGDVREVRIAPALVQPIAGDDIADFMADTVMAGPGGGIVEIAGPEALRLDDVATEIATAYEDGRRIVSDVEARYFGARLAERSLLPGAGAWIGPRRFDDWLRNSLQPDAHC
ncbi:SDR family oxidoreductase [Sphingomonas sp. ASY06-1R]|uniref:SDR family oxidoreductase n=1 Tax=Sphingomonas sp. ASY06-1R TaxID=3445771 RepID=UPI003FA26148